MKTPAPREWRAAAGLLSALVPAGALHPAFVSWAAGRPRGEKWGIALSGGADSVGLLLLAWAHWPARRGAMTAFHFNHRLRGAASAADARFCAALCRALGVPLVSGRWGAGRRSRGEAHARLARFAFLEPEMAARGIRVLLLGHQQDDIAESMLMRLARGSGTAGLAAPRPVHALDPVRKGGRGVIHARPLLSLKKGDIVGALRAAGAAWREDSSNARGIHFRNRVRKAVIRGWVEASQRDALAGAALSRELLDEDNQALEAWVEALAPVGADGSLDTGRLRGMPRAVTRRALHRWLLVQKDAGDASRQAFGTLLRSVESGAPVRHSLGSHGFAVIRGGKLRFERQRKPRSLH
jgi:tRNA(Ile)-lysidine synthase